MDCRKDIIMTINDILYLETLLMKIRSHTSTYSIRKEIQKRKKREILEDLHDLESLPYPSKKDLQNIATKQSEIGNERADANEGHIIRSRT